MYFYLLNINKKLLFIILLFNLINAFPFIDNNSITVLSKIQNEQPLHLQAKRKIVPPHCSKSIITESQSSRLTRRSITSTSQMSLNIGVGQTVCFRLNETEENNLFEAISVNEEETRKTSLINQRNVASKNRRALNSFINKSLSTKQLNNLTNSKNLMEQDEPKKDEINNLLNTLTLVELEQYHAITERYRFAIPEVETNCICECNPLASTCQADEWKYGECTNINAGNEFNRKTVCHRTFFANQPSGSCPSAMSTSDSDKFSSNSRLCCQLRFRLYKNRIFTAIRLEASTTYAILQHSIYKYQNDKNSTQDEWSEIEKRKIRVQLDGAIHSSVLNSKLGLKLSILGLGGKSSANELEPGMYFVENLPNNKYSEIIFQPLNRITEHDFHKLGWFRIDENGDALVQSGDIFLDKIHHAKTNNCAEQRFRSVLEASYYVNNGDNNTSVFQLAEPLSHNQKWIRSARLFDSSLRQAVVKAGEGNNLEITLTVPSISQTPSSITSLEESIILKRRRQQQQQRNRRIYSNRLSITFVHNSSKLYDFTGLILVDKFSNSLLNLSIYGGKGVLNGFVRQLTDWNGEDIDTFSVTIPQLSTQIRQSINDDNFVTVIERVKPYPINSIQVVCLRPDDADSSHEICRPVQSVELKLEMNTVRNDWSNRIGSCADCNHFTVEGFMKYLNPMNWTKGINSVSDALMLASNFFIYLLGAIILYCLIVKIIIPIASCCLCPMQVFYTKSKK